MPPPKKSKSRTTSSESTTIIVWDVVFLKSWLCLVNICCTCFVWTSRRSVILSLSCWQVGWPVADWYLRRKPQFRPLFRCQHSSLFRIAFRVFFSVVSVCVSVSAVESVENKFSRLAHRFVSAEEANTAFFWCLGIPLTHLAQSLVQKPQENETLLQQTKLFKILFCSQDLYFLPFWRQSHRGPALCGLPVEFMFAVGNVSVLSNGFVVKSLPS